MKQMRRVAIANRGEVAVRIIRACEELGLETVLLHSDADIQSRAYRMATKKIGVGSSTAASNCYLDKAALINAALAAGADSLHPGFGFLSENADFAEECEKSSLTFIGPPADSIRKLGDKIYFKNLAKKAGLPLIPGYEGEDQSVNELLKQVQKIGLPVIVKAAAGGGGRGMKLIREMNEAKEQIESAQREALSAFGSTKVFLEKYLARAKHIEFQIFGDSTGHVVHLFDRECSVQRRHQKIIEEATSPSLTEDLRRKMGEVACSIASLGRYKNAGTVEFLLQDNQFYLLEVNTRLQVEHPVTEEVLGVDLVKMQILTAQGNFIFSPQDVRLPKGHSIECRVYAENPYESGLPSTGKLGLVHWPDGPRRRFEYGFEAGDTITSHYDPMIAKVIVWDETRSRAIDKMICTLKDSVVFGVYTNIPYLIEILNHEEFRSAKMTTNFIETYFAQGLKLTVADEKIKNWAQIIHKNLHKKLKSSQTAGPTDASATANPWATYWRGAQ